MTFFLLFPITSKTIYCNYVLQLCIANMYCKYVLQICIANMYWKYVLEICIENMYCKYVLQMCIATMYCNYVLDLRNYCVKLIRSFLEFLHSQLFFTLKKRITTWDTVNP